MSFASARVLVVGVGGLGCPSSLALARAGVGMLGLVDHDEVETTNLHRQILFHDSDVGKPKAVTAKEALARFMPTAHVEAHVVRFEAGNALEIVRGYDLVVEGTDDFATKFLAADAAHLAEKPIVHAAAVRWHGTVLATDPQGKPCYRCLFEDVPAGPAQTCAGAGVVGPVLGILAAAQADFALRMLRGEALGGSLFAFDGRSLEARRRRIPQRKGCSLCDARSIRDIQSSRYAPAFGGDAPRVC